MLKIVSFIVLASLIVAGFGGWIASSSTHARSGDDLYGRPALGGQMLPSVF